MEMTTIMTRGSLISVISARNAKNLVITVENIVAGEYDTDTTAEE